MSFTTQQHDRSVAREEAPLSRPWIARLTLIVISLIVLVNLAAALVAAGYQIYYDGLIYPGVSVWGIDLSGMTPREAADALNGQFDYPQTAAFTFRDGLDIWQFTAAELGVKFDVERTVQAAYEVGRQPSLTASLRQQATAWRQGLVIAPVIVYDQQSADIYLRRIAQEIDQPPLDATLRVEDLRAVTTASQIGRQVDVGATLALLTEPISDLQGGEITIVVAETPPRVADASDAAAIVNAILADDLQVYIENPLADDPGPWTASREALADMLVIDRVTAADGASEYYTVRLNEDQLHAFLDPLVPQLARDPLDARFVFNDETRQLEPIQASRPGRNLDVEATIQLINQLAPAAQSSIPLVFETIEPEIPDTATAEDLGITELISSATTYFAGSGSQRVANIGVAASRFHGIVVRPREEFSFNHYLGDVSEETGFERGLIIAGGRTIEGVGGGVCQVSTTTFQAAFYAGFPIVERWPHGYRVSYYEVGEGAGMDATVYAPFVDLRFVNDLDTYLLIETYLDRANATLTFLFYSTGDGRTVQKDGPHITNIVPHGPAVYEENPERAPGEVKQVDYAVDGADVTVYRTVYRDGEILYEDTFFSQYLAWQAVYEVAPGHVPPGADTTEESGLLPALQVLFEWFLFP